MKTTEQRLAEMVHQMRLLANEIADMEPGEDNAGACARAARVRLEEAADHLNAARVEILAAEKVA
jgi:hypothetical protein